MTTVGPDCFRMEKKKEREREKEKKKKRWEGWGVENDIVTKKQCY